MKRFATRVMPILVLWFGCLAATAADIQATDVLAQSSHPQQPSSPLKLNVSQPIREGEYLPNIYLQGLRGTSREMADFAGAPLIINVWASWCSPCRAEMASLERLAWMDDVGDVAIIGVSTDDFRERAEAYLDSINPTILHFLDTELRIEQLLGATRIPLTVLVNAQGQVVKKVYGAKAWDDPAAVNMVRTLLNDAGAP